MNRPLFISLFFLCCALQGAQAFDLSTLSTQRDFSLIEKKLNYDPTPYLLPSTHRLKPILDSLFPAQTVIQDAHSLEKAGFILFRVKKSSGIYLVKHPQLPGYLIKLYPLSQSDHREDMSKQNWLIQRCRGAAKFRKLIREHHIQHFVAPKKWLYELPKLSGQKTKRTFVVIETFMHLVSEKETKKAWKEKITKQHLQEFLLFTKIGGTSGSGGLLINTPYTKEGQFAFIDTEYPDRIFPPSTLKKMGRYFSKEMSNYWKHLVEKSQ